MPTKVVKTMWVNNNGRIRDAEITVSEFKGVDYYEEYRWGESYYWDLGDTVFETELEAVEAALVTNAESLKYIHQTVLALAESRADLIVRRTQLVNS